MVQKHVAYEPVWRVPPTAPLLRPTFRQPGTKQERVPPWLEFPEDKVARRFNADEDIKDLFTSLHDPRKHRLHPFGHGVIGVQGGEQKDPGPLAPDMVRLQAMLRHGPLFIPKVRQRFVAHHQRVVAKLTEQFAIAPTKQQLSQVNNQAYGIVKEALVKQYAAFEERNEPLLEKTGQMNLIVMRDSYNKNQMAEERALYTNNARRALYHKENKVKSQRRVLQRATLRHAENMREAEEQRRMDGEEARRAQQSGDRGGARKGRGGGAARQAGRRR